MSKQKFATFVMLGIWALSSSARAFTLNSSYDSSLKGWSGHKVVFHLNPANCPSNVSSIISKAIAIWNGVGTSDLKVSLGSDSTATYAELAAGTVTDVPVILCDTNFLTDAGAPADSGILGVAKVTPPSRGQSIAYAYLMINVQSGDNGDISDASTTLGSIVMAHEMGHVLGLGHSQTDNALMYYDASAKEALGLAQDDIDGISYLYPRNELGSKAMGCGLVKALKSSGEKPRGPGPWVPLILLLLPGVVVAGLRSGMLADPVKGGLLYL